MKWQCRSCGRMVTGPKKAVQAAKKVPCSKKHQVEVIYAKPV